MRERKFIKIKVNMYDDTKFKIIDIKPERDLIHYVWTRILVLAGKVNLEGDLYLSKNIQYTVETLAIEFNREVNQIKLALDVFMELEMIELTENNVYRVKNFAKHQNLKVKENVKIYNKEEDAKIKEVKIKDNSKDVIKNNEVKDTKITLIEKKEAENRISENKILTNEKIDNNVKVNMPIILAEKKKKGSNNKKNENKNKNNIYMDDEQEENEDDTIVQFFEGDEEIPLKEGDTVLWHGLLSDSSGIS